MSSVAVAVAMIQANVVAANTDDRRSDNSVVTLPTGTTVMGGESIPTMNKFGWQFPIDPYSAFFVEDAVRNSTADSPAIEIAAAYGVATPFVLARGGHMIANDLDQRHLTVLEQRIPINDRSRLRVLHGAFPDQITAAIRPGSLSTLLCANLLHFFDGPTILHGLRTMKEWVKPGAYLYLVTFSVHHRFSESYSVLYEEARQRGDQYPGCQYNDVIVARVKTEPITERFTVEKRAEVVKLYENAPQLLHFMDDQVFPRLIREAGFEVIRCEYFACAPNMPACNDGREMIGCIARRPVTDM